MKTIIFFLLKRFCICGGVRFACFRAQRQEHTRIKAATQEVGIIQVKGGFVHKNAMSPEAMQRMRQVVRRSFTRAVPQDGDPDRRVWY